MKGLGENEAVAQQLDLEPRRLAPGSKCHIARYVTQTSGNGSQSSITGLVS